jgi:hypothetical protein
MASVQLQRILADRGNGIAVPDRPDYTPGRSTDVNESSRSGTTSPYDDDFAILVFAESSP